MIATEVELADRFLSRMVGLLNRASLKPNEALMITRCQSIHMFFMRFAIDVIFVDSRDCVVGLVKHIKPFQLSPIFPKASYAIELPTNSIASSNTCLGDQLIILKY